jgi:hypothetical protein
MAVRINVLVFGVFILLRVAPCTSFIFSELLGIKSSETQTTSTPSLEQNSTSFNRSTDLTRHVDNFTTQASSTKQANGRLNHTLTQDRENIKNSEVRKAADRKAEEKMHIEYIKKQLMAKLRLSAPPVTQGQAPALPLAEVGWGHYQTQHDQGRHKYRARHFYANTMQIYVMGTDGKQASTFCFEVEIGNFINIELCHLKCFTKKNYLLFQ